MKQWTPEQQERLREIERDLIAKGLSETAAGYKAEEILKQREERLERQKELSTR